MPIPPPDQKCDASDCPNPEVQIKGYTKHGDCTAYLCGRCVNRDQENIERFRTWAVPPAVHCGRCGTSNIPLDDVSYGFLQKGGSDDRSSAGGDGT